MRRMGFKNRSTISVISLISVLEYFKHSLIEFIGKEIYNYLLDTMIFRVTCVNGLFYNLLRRLCFSSQILFFRRKKKSTSEKKSILMLIIALNIEIPYQITV